MGNFFSGQFTHYRPPFHRRTSSRRSRRLLSLTSTSAGTSAITANASSFWQGNEHRPLSPTGSSSSDQQPSSSVGNVNSQSQLLTKQRKPSLKMTLKRAYSNASTSPNVFSDERRQLVHASWQAIVEKLGKLQIATKIFQNLFRASPNIRAMFDLPSVDFRLDEYPSFVRHAQVFANVLDLAVRNVFELETEVGPVLIMFGRRHYYKHRVDFRNEYLTLFAESISDVVHANMTESFSVNPEVGVGWRLFISYVIKKIKEGYEFESLTRK